MIEAAGERSLGEELHVPRGRGRIGRHTHLACQLFESEHFDIDRPVAVRQVAEREGALFIGGGDDFRVAPRGGDGGAGKR